ncbi:MAG: pseudouridine synthase [Candidatus Bathyarchaeota archaeon]|nr:pseudouridine synthase [Candidatus Bathyarchaeota archaeon]
MSEQQRKRHLLKIRNIANYQFETSVGDKLFPNDVELRFSKRTGRIRHIYHNNRLLATLKPTDGLFSLTIHGAKRLHSLPRQVHKIIVQSDIEAFVKKGKTVFAKHVIYADERIRAGDEVLVTSRDDVLLAVGKATLSGPEILAFKRGIAVKVRQGVDEA